MTEKQKNYIDWICNVLDIKFKGTTKQEAWKFINEYKDEAHSTYRSDYYDEWDYEMRPDEGYYC